MFDEVAAMAEQVQAFAKRERQLEEELATVKKDLGKAERSKTHWKQKYRMEEMKKDLAYVKPGELKTQAAVFVREILEMEDTFKFGLDHAAAAFIKVAAIRPDRPVWEEMMLVHTALAIVGEEAARKIMLKLVDLNSDSSSS